MIDRSAYRETRGLLLWLLPVEVHIQHPGSGWPAPQKPKPFADRGLFTLEHDLDTTVAEIPDKPRKSQVARAPTRRPTKAHSLDSSLYQGTDAHDPAHSPDESAATSARSCWRTEPTSNFRAPAVIFVSADPIGSGGPVSRRPPRTKRTGLIRATTKFLK